MVKVVSQRLSRHCVIILPMVSLIFWGCTQGETPKKVSLLERAPPVSASESGENKDVLQFGVDIRLGPKEDIRIFTPLLRYLQETSGLRFRILFTEKYEHTIDNLGTGITSFAVIGPLSYVMGRDKYGDSIGYLLSGVNDEGDARSRAAIFARTESTITTLRDLKNRTFAFGSRMSTQGHLIPRKMLEDGGITLSDLASHTFTGSHIRTVRSVLNKEHDAGAAPVRLAARLASEGKIKILQISNPYPSTVIAYNRKLEKGLVENIRSALLDFEPGGRHGDMVTEWEKTEMPLGFTRVSETEFYSIAILARKYGLLTR